MRSIFLHIAGSSQTTVRNFLNATYPSQKNPWIYEKNGDSYFYINFMDNVKNEAEDGEIESIEKKLGGKIDCSITVDISGRHPGDPELLEFLNLFLTTFNGVAQDDYTIFPWLLSEINTNFKVKDHPFFDYSGWYDEQE